MSELVNTLFEAWNFRHACKAFDPNYLISEDDMRVILEAGRLSPSSFGFEPWKFLVIQNKALREAMLPLCWGAQGQLPTASHVVLFLARMPLAVAPDSEYIQQTIMKETQQLPDDIARMRTAKFTEFMEHDFGYGDNIRARFEWAARQCYIALGNMLTTAALLGIDSCPMEGFDKDALEKLLQDRGILDRREFGVAVMAAFGRRVSEPRPKTRRTAETVVEWIE